MHTDRIDLLQLHGFDAATPVEESLSALDALVRDGKVRYVGVSHHAGWQLMKALAAADRLHLPRYVAHQVCYSPIGRDYEWELMPLAADQGVGALVWSPLGWGRLTGRTVPQVAINWLLRRPTVSSVIVGAREEDQLRDNLGATGWELTPDQVARLDAVSHREPPYHRSPYHRQEGFARLDPPMFALA
ncbi:aldo/keto reductase [Nocardiopsis sp. CNR-923]|uniref:aldo/keto reductase n=1 Tax=Nocardiopsis sp. CNR-923 TaxID=1904965 RepID=UPI000A8E45AE|nr:aldo/keto reductase [Nocardiopsis sp. CNR-923]